MYYTIVHVMYQYQYIALHDDTRYYPARYSTTVPLSGGACLGFVVIYGLSSLFNDCQAEHCFFSLSPGDKC